MPPNLLTGQAKNGHLIRSFDRLWPVVILALGFCMAFRSFELSTAIVVIGVLVQIARGKLITIVRERRSGVLLLFTSIAVVMELVSWQLSSLPFNSQASLHFTTHFLLIILILKLSPPDRLTMRLAIWGILVIALYYCGVMFVSFTRVAGEATAIGFNDVSLFRNSYSPLGGINEWSQTLILSLGLAVLLLLKARGFERLLALIMSSALVLAILICFSRGAYLGLVILVGIPLIAGGIIHRRLIRKRHVLAVTLALAALTVVLWPYRDAVAQTLAIDNTESQQRSAQSRLAMWDVAQEHIGDLGLTGEGAYNFGLFYNLARAASPDDPPISRPSSIFTQFAVERGLLGSLPYVALLILLGFLTIRQLKLLTRRGPQAAKDRLLLVIVAATFIAAVAREATMPSIFYRGSAFHLLSILMGVWIIYGLRDVDGDIKPGERWHRIVWAPFIVLVLATGVTMVHEARVERTNKAYCTQMRKQLFAKARSTSDRLLELTNSHPVAHLHAAASHLAVNRQHEVTWDRFFRIDGDPAQAIKYLQYAAALEPRDETIQFALGCAYASEGRWDSARFHVGHAFEVDPGQAVYAVVLGMIVEKQGNIENAFVHYRHAMAVNPDLARSAFFKDLSARQGRATARLIEEAITYRTTVLRGEGPIHQARLGALHFFAGDYQLAASALSEASRSLPGMNRPYYYLGRMALFAGDTVNAEILLNKSVYLDPDDRLVTHALTSLSSPQISDNRSASSAHSPSGEPFYQKRRQFYRSFVPFRNTTLDRYQMAYFKPRPSR